MAERISRRSLRNSRSRITRTLERASGTLIVVRISMIVKSTRSSTRVSPLVGLRRILLHAKGQSRAAGEDHLPLGVAHREIGNSHGGGAFGASLKDKGGQEAGAGGSEEH